MRWFFWKKSQRRRKVFGFLCDPELAVGVKMLAAALESPIYPLAEHLLQLGARQIAPALKDPELTKRLQQHLLKGHLLVSAPSADDGERMAAKRGRPASGAHVGAGEAYPGPVARPEWRDPAEQRAGAAPVR